MIAQARFFRSIEERLDDIVRRAEECVTKTNAIHEDLEESQLRNLQNLASATDSVRVLENFISYQMGRKKIPTNVGRRILEDLRWLENQADEIISQEKAHPQAKRRLWMEMIQMYLGFLVRKFVAEKKSKEEIS